MRKPNAIPGGGAMPIDRMKNNKTLGACAPNSHGVNGILSRSGKYAVNAKAFSTENNISEQCGTSIFDPTLCELAYKWFCSPGGTILDPFAGGSVRGIVAAKLGYKYIGVDLSERQINANIDQAQNICMDNIPKWIVGNSKNIDKLCSGVNADFIFSCPPYADLELYSNDENDLSTMPYDKFIEAYRDIIKKTCLLLRQDAFACFCVGEVRGKDGNYYGFVPDTIKAFTDAGLKYYNEMILVTAVGSLPIRVGRQFNSGRKVGKTHQNVLVFLNGDAKKAVKKIGPVEFAEINEAAA